MPPMIGIDSNALTYLATAMSGEYDPTGDPSNLRDERVGMLRVFLYDEATMCVTPTVKGECSRVPLCSLKSLHEAIGDVLLLDGPWNFDHSRLDSRATELAAYHTDRNDRRILAEAEQAGFRALLTFDRDFVSRLGPRARDLELCTPSVYLARLQIKAGATPVRTPARGNPLESHRWWRIEE